MTEATKAWLIVGIAALVLAAAGLAFWLVRGGSGALTAESLYQQTIAATNTQEYLAAVKQSPDLECDEFLRYNELMDQWSADNYEALSLLEEGLLSELTFAELLNIGLRVETKERECRDQTDQSGDDSIGLTLSQRENNQRQTDVFQIASAINTYMGNNSGQPPESRSDIAPYLGDGLVGLGHYQITDINPARSLNQSTPAEDGDFPSHTQLADTPSPGMIHYDDGGDLAVSDIVVVMRAAQCSDESDQPESANARLVVILHRLADQPGVVCLDV